MNISQRVFLVIARTLNRDGRTDGQTDRRTDGQGDFYRASADFGEMLVQVCFCSLQTV